MYAELNENGTPMEPKSEPEIFSISKKDLEPDLVSNLGCRAACFGPAGGRGLSVNSSFVSNGAAPLVI